MAFSSEFEGTAKRRKCTTLNTMEADVTADTLPLYRTDCKLCPHCGEVFALKTFKLVANDCITTRYIYILYRYAAIYLQ